MFFEVGKACFCILVRVPLPIDLFAVWTLPELFDIGIFITELQYLNSFTAVHQHKIWVIALHTSRQQIQLIHVDFEVVHHLSRHIFRFRRVNEVNGNPCIFPSSKILILCENDPLFLGSYRDSQIIILNRQVGSIQSKIP